MFRSLSPRIWPRTLLLMTESSTYSPVLSLVRELVQAAVDPARKPTRMRVRTRRALLNTVCLHVHRQARRAQHQRRTKLRFPSICRRRFCRGHRSLSVKKVRRVARSITNRRLPFSLCLADRLPNRVLHAADGILNLALGLFSFAFRFRLFVPQKAPAAASSRVL